MPYYDPIVEEIHAIRHELLAEHNGAVHSYNKMLAAKSFDGFRMATIEPVKPFAWNDGLRPAPLAATA